MPELSRKEQLDSTEYELAQRQILLKEDLKHSQDDYAAALAKAEREDKRAAKYAGQLKGDLASGVALVERDKARAHGKDIDKARENLALLQAAYSRHISELQKAPTEYDPDQTEEAPMPAHGQDDLAA